MEENIERKEGINLMEILRLLLSKIKLLILIVILGGIVGGAYGYLTTYKVKYYGTKIEFYVNPDNPKDTTEESQFGVYGAYGVHVMDNMVKLLASESFTEYLILEGNPLPSIKNGTSSPTLEGLINEANTAIEVAKKAEEESDKQAASTEELLTSLKQNWKKEMILLYPESSTSLPVYSKENFALLEDKLTPTLKEQHALYETEQKKADSLWQTAKDKAKDSSAAIEKALEDWRTTREYAKDLERYSGKVSYSYLGETEDRENANELARSFIYVSISVREDDGTIANELRTKVINIVPEYIKKHMAIPNGYQSTNCQRITRTDEVYHTNQGNATNQMIKMGILLAVAAGIVACIIIIVNDRSDKRLRDQETITRLFNIPVLGVVPTIEDSLQNNAKKDLETNTNKEVK